MKIGVATILRCGLLKFRVSTRDKIARAYLQALDVPVIASHSYRNTIVTGDFKNRPAGRRRAIAVRVPRSLDACGYKSTKHRVGACILLTCGWRRRREMRGTRRFWSLNWRASSLRESELPMQCKSIDYFHVSCLSFFGEKKGTGIYRRVKSDLPLLTFTIVRFSTWNS